MLLRNVHFLHLAAGGRWHILHLLCQFQGAGERIFKQHFNQLHQNEPRGVISHIELKARSAGHSRDDRSVGGAVGGLLAVAGQVPYLYVLHHAGSGRYPFHWTCGAAFRDGRSGWWHSHRSFASHLRCLPVLQQGQDQSGNCTTLNCI